MRPLLFLIMLIAGVSCHAGSNLANDYFDHVKGVDTEKSLGSSQVILQDLLTPTEVRRGMITAFAIATILGLIIVASAGWPILILALLSLAAAVLYTGGPKPLGYIALGEIIAFVFMGPVMVTGAYYVLANRITLSSLILSLPIGFLVTLIMQANNIRDIDVDRHAGKITIATMVGRSTATWHYVACVLAAYVSIPLLIWSDRALWPTLIIIASIPAARFVTKLLFNAANDRDLNVVLRKSAGLHLRFGLLLTIGLIVATVVNRLS